MAVFLVNEEGAVHSVSDVAAPKLLESKDPAYKKATAEQIENWYEAQGLPVPGAKKTEPAK